MTVQELIELLGNHKHDTYEYCITVDEVLDIGIDINDERETVDLYRNSESE